MKKHVTLVSGEANYIPGVKDNTGRGILYKGRYVSSITITTNGNQVVADMRDGCDIMAIILKRTVLNRPVLVNYENYVSEPAILGGLYIHKGRVVVTD